VGIIALLIGAFALLAPAAAARPPQAPKPPGNSPYAPTPLDVTIPGSPLSVVVRPSGSYAVYRNNIQQFYGGYAEGPYLWVNGAVWGPEQVPAGNAVNMYTPISSVLTGSGTAGDPWLVTNVLEVGNTGLRLTQETRYVNGQEFIRNDWTLCNTGNTSYTNIHLFHAADLWTDNNDFGYGYYDAATGAVGGYNQAMTLFQIFVPITRPARYEEDFYGTIWGDIGSTSGPGPGLHNTYRPNDYIDNGAALEWTFDLPAGACVTTSDYQSFATVPVLPTATNPPSNTPVSTAAATVTRTPAPTNTPSCGTSGGHYFTANLSGDQETPPNNSTGTGTGTFFLDASGTTITYNVTYQNLVGTPAASHLHRAAPGVAGPIIVPLTCCPNPLSGTAPWDPANTSALLAGNVYVNIHSNLFPGGEIRGQLIEHCATPSATATPAPVCTSPTPVVVVTPAFTPGPGCSATPGNGVLDATITTSGTTTTAVFTNHSTTCSYPIGLATYQRFDSNIDHQVLYDYALAVIPPHSSLTLTVNNPTCAYQADAFYGNLIVSFAGGVRYGSRLLDDTVGHDNNYCTPVCPPPTATATPVCATATPVVVVTPAFTPGPGCSATPGTGVLDATITNNGATTQALFTNHSSTCSYPIGLATYQRFDNNIDHQVLYDYELAVIPPNSSLTLTVNNPPCSFQADAFYGNLIVSFAGGVRYGSRLLDDTINHSNYCTPVCVTPAATPTTPPQATSTPTTPPQGTSTPTAPPQGTSTPTTPPQGTSTATPPPPTSTRTPQATSTRTPQPTSTATPVFVCTVGTAIPVHTPAFTPGPTCQGTPGPGVLTAQITEFTNSAEAVFTNTSTTCDYFIGFASYSEYDANPEHDVLYDYSLVIIPPNSVVTLTLALPRCAYQTDAFYGPMLVSFAGGASYGNRLLAHTVSNGRPFCSCGLIATPTPVAACTTSFSDVPPGSTFYPYVHCLLCGGIVSGYPDGTFRPGNLVTRGQVAKIIANSASLDEAIPQTDQTFADVPPSQTFWLWIERVARHGLVSGYPCGGPGEACNAGNQPYFRPNNNVTRGQLAKIAATAAGFNEPVTSLSFADVPADNPFYAVIERMAARGIINGYPCGGPGEGCNAAHQPYYRPNNPITRGQMSKIDSMTFFPTCTSNP
jgi:hypothetical protein